MKIYKYSVRAVITLLLLLVLIVLFFPLAFDNEQIYKVILFSSIAIVLILMLFLIWINAFVSHQNKNKIHN
jgi:cytosine/uracil/thiamine/allantoin permease